MTRGLGERWLLDEVAIKPFPICHLLHACADSAIALREKHRIEPHDIVRVRALLHPETFHYVAEPPEMRRRPVSDYMAKFSVQFVVAACLIRGKFGYAELESDALEDKAILDLAQRVSHEADPESAFPKYFSGGVVVKLRDGRELVHMERINRGAGERALSADDIAAKFSDNAELVLTRSKAERIRDLVLELDKRSASELAAVLAGVRASGLIRIPIAVIALALQPVAAIQAVDVDESVCAKLRCRGEQRRRRQPRRRDTTRCSSRPPALHAEALRHRSACDARCRVELIIAGPGADSCATAPPRRGDSRRPWPRARKTTISSPRPFSVGVSARLRRA